jgi:hypothetical protein
MSLSRDVLLFSIVLMLWAVRIETAGYEGAAAITGAALAVAVVGLLGSAVSSLRSVSQPTGSDSDASGPTE